MADQFRPTERQREAINAADTGAYVLYGGARGGGKSRFLRWYMLRVLHRWARQGLRAVRVGIFCEDFPSLLDRQIAKAREEFPVWMGTWNLADHEFRLPDQYGAGVICFRNLDRPEKYLSAEFAAIGIDELTQNPVDIFTKLHGSKRWPGIAKTIWIGTTNPGGIGHGWVKDIWISRNFGLAETRSLVEASEPGETAPFQRSDFTYVKSLPTDNPYLSSTYLAQLRSLPPRQRAAYFDGNWDVFEGQAFEELDRTVHVRDLEPTDEWTWFAGLDWGYENPGCLTLHATGPIEDTVAVVGARYFQKEKAMLAGKLCGVWLQRFPKLPEAIYYDSQMNAKTGEDRTIIELFDDGLHDALGEYAPVMYGVAKGSGSRTIRKQLLHDRLHYEVDEQGNAEPLGAGGPRVVYAPRDGNGADKLFEELQALPVDPDGKEDVDDKAMDHGYDSHTYALYARTPDWQPPIVSREVQKQRQALDPASRAEAESMEKLERELSKPRRKVRVE